MTSFKVPAPTDPGVRAKFASYPAPVRAKLMRLRKLVFETAHAYGVVDTLTESLKWGEPSYLAKGGSALRMDWKLATPKQYALYFQCQSSLVSTFRELHGQVLSFEGSRAIVFRRAQALPVAPVRHCISLALRYKRLKHLPLLGA